MTLTRCSISKNLCWNLVGSHLLKTQCAQSFLTFLTSPAAACMAAENTGTPPSSVSTAEASQWSSKALNLAMKFSTYNLAKSMWDNTLQSNKEKLYFPPGSFGWQLLPLMFSYFKNFLAGHLWRRPDVLCVWILWLVLRLLYSLSTSCSTKGRICGTRILLSAIPMTSHRFWLSVKPAQLNLKINDHTNK